MKAELLNVPKHGGKDASMLVIDGRPVLIKLETREATTRGAYGRLKAKLVVPDPTDPDACAPLPYAQAGNAVTCEFRIEAN